MLTERKPASPEACILIVDDEPANVRLLHRMLVVAGYTNVHTTTSSADAIALFVRISPDIVLLDLHMPELDGIALMRRSQAMLAPGDFLPMVMLTGDLSPDVRRLALAEGAIDFVTKPFELDEVLLRIRNLLQTRMLHLELRTRNEELEMRVQERTGELEKARLDILARLALAAEYRDDATGQHTRRVGLLTEGVARSLGVGALEAESMGRAAMLHDIGKIGIPDAILLKPGSLTAEEFGVIRRHTVIGRDILAGSPAPLLQLAETIAFTHHERWDGRGYHGLVSDAIPLAGRIVTVADTFDVMINGRPYRGPVSLQAAKDELVRERGGQFDPDIVDAFLDLVGRQGVPSGMQLPGA
jgi:putative two-component system response regulator